MNYSLKFHISITVWTFIYDLGFEVSYIKIQFEVWNMKYGLKSKRMRIGNTILWQSSCKKKGNEAQRRRPVYRNASTDFFNMTMNGSYVGNIGTSIIVGSLLVPLTILLISLSLFSVTVLLREKTKSTGLDNVLKEKAMKACLVQCIALYSTQDWHDTIY